MPNADAGRTGGGEFKEDREGGRTGVQQPLCLAGTHALTLIITYQSSVMRKVSPPPTWHGGMATTTTIIITNPELIMMGEVSSTSYPRLAPSCQAAPFQPLQPQG